MRALRVFYNTLTAGATDFDRHVPRALFFQGETLRDGYIDNVILLKLDKKVWRGKSENN